MQDKKELVAFLSRWAAIVTAAEGVEPPRHYARIRAGRTRRAADTVWRRDITGEDAPKLADEVIDRFTRLDKGSKAWLEIMAKGGTGTVDVLPLGEAHGEDADGDAPAGLGDLDMSTGAGVIGVVVHALVETNGQLASRLGANESKYHDLLVKHIEVSGRAASAETMLDWIEKHGIADDGAMAAAIETLGPMLAPVLASMASKATGKAPKVNPKTPEERATKAIAEVTDLCDHHPEVLRAKQLELMALGMKLQDIVMPKSAA